MQQQDKHLFIFTTLYIKTMKKLTILSIIMLFGLIGLAQEDTTVFFESKTIDVTFAEILKEGEWKTIDSINFDITQDSAKWSTSRWKIKDSIYINPNRYKIKEFQRRMNQQGILQRKSRVIRYTKRTVIKRSIR